MPPLDSPTLLVLAAIVFALVTTILHTLARTMTEEQKVAELRARVVELRRSYTKRLAELSGTEAVEVVSQEEAPRAIPMPAPEGPAALKQAA